MSPAIPARALPNTAGDLIEYAWPQRRFQAKAFLPLDAGWIAVRVKKTRQKMNLERDRF
jgi:hypothetical protein